MSVVIILIAFLATFIIACKQTGNRRIPMLKNRQADRDAWIFADIDPTITEAYLGIIANAFMLHGPEQIFKLRPDDSLNALYNSCYPSQWSRLGGDSLELEICCIDIEKLSQSDTVFDPNCSLYHLLKKIAQSRNNRPLSDQEITSLCGASVAFKMSRAPDGRP